MENLDTVYNTLSKLESNFARSNKSRADYIMDKFGGDIRVASFLIMNTLSKEDITSAEDIDKLSYVRQELSFLVNNQHSLNSLSSFNFFDCSSSASSSAVQALDFAMTNGRGIEVLSQKEMYSKPFKPLMYGVNKNAVIYTPISQADYLVAINDAFVNFLSGQTKKNINLGDVCKFTTASKYEPCKKVVFS